MPFVKLDCGVLDSSLWVDRVCREIFITSLLMAVPHELLEPEPELATRSLDRTGFSVPPGWYGLVNAAGPGIINRALIEDYEAGMSGLLKLASPDPESRSQAFEGRRMVRINGGFIILNYDKYRERDYTASDRMRRYRARKRQAVTSNVDSVHRNVTQAEVDTEEEAIKTKDNGQQADRFPEFWRGYPKKVKKQDAQKVWKSRRLDSKAEEIIQDVKDRLAEDGRWLNGFVPDPPTYLRGSRWEDEFTEVTRK